MAEENNRKNKLISDKQNTFFTENRIMKGSAIPTEGTYLTGDMIINTDPVTSIDEPMWICNEGGTPGVWGPVSNTSTTIVPTYASMLKSKASVGSLFYVIADENDASEAGAEPGFYIVTSIKEENGVKIPATWDKINKKDNNIPKLSYDASMPEGTKIYLNDTDELIVKFNFSASTFGDGKYRVYMNGSLLKSWSGPKGNVVANLGRITADGTYEITVSATDYLTVPAPETLSFTAIVGGLKLTSTFDQTLLSAIYEEGDYIEFPYIVSLADASQTMKMKFSLVNNNNGETVFDDSIPLQGTYMSAIWQSPVINKSGLYTLTAQAFTGKSVTDTSEGVFVSNKLEYTVRILKENEIAIIDESKGIQYNNNMYVSIPFKIISKIADYFVMKGELYRDNNGSLELVTKTNDTGISSKVNVVNYWSVGKLPIGNYQYKIKGYTVDGLVESEEVIVSLEVVESQYKRVPYVNNANLIAYFDANTKGNNDGSPNIWDNSSEHTGDKYRILLHGLNYNTNGWKHVDETIPDEKDGEMMLKFTGESYGEMVEMVNGEPRPYSPFSIFKMGGQPGITIETAIRTRNIGEINTRVLTCMKFNDALEDPLTEPGVSITYDTMAISSNSQVNKLQFMEDEWVHIALVVDKNVRSESYVGIDFIEDVNPTHTLRVYINGVLCSCTTIDEDESKENFIDGAREAYPLVLNAARIIDAAGNVSFDHFGECEIKFIRIYNSYLKSSEVLQNYISHIYDQDEQQRKDDKNNTDLNTLPTIVFKRKPDVEGNKTFAYLHSITNKKESKKSFVDCVMEFDDGKGKRDVFNNVDVYLQGTSSLQYPVKNYKIKTWSDESKKTEYKFAPPGKEGDWVPDNCYTLKCD